MKIKEDLLSRILYATDASPYREIPYGVAHPKSQEELVKLVRWASQNGRYIIPRGAGTSLAGQVVGDGVVVEISHHFNKILEINRQESWVRVEPGIVLDRLNRELSKVGLWFGPETSTSNRCNIGGMVGNNSCGAHSLIWGSTRDHLLEAKVILADGSTAHFRDLSEEEFLDKQQLKGLEGDIYRYMASLISNKKVRSEVEKEFPDPQVKRRNSGYALDLFFESNYNLCKLLAGSEGTLALVTEVKLNVVPLPPEETLLLCAHSNSLQEALKANLVALEHNPTAVELMDSNILELSKENLTQRKNRFFIKGDPAAILIIEFASHSLETLEEIGKSAERALLESGLVYHCSYIYKEEAPKVWELRKSGLGLLSSMSGDVKSVSVIEDTAVAPHKLPQYIHEFQSLLERYSLECVYHAHVGSGELHIRPLLNLKSSHDRAIFKSIAQESALLVKRFGGSLSGEHGDGRLRGQFIPLMYGEFLYRVMGELKRVFDPNLIFNRGKIVDTPPMESSLRYEEDVETKEFKSFFHFYREGGYMRAIEQCNGSGDCLKSHLFNGTMCPSYRATLNEVDSTRGRANILRELLTHPTKRNPFAQKEVVEALDLCLSCKGCKSECPSNVDMASYKAEYLQHYYNAKGTPFRTLLIAHISSLQRVGAAIPKLYNFLISNKVTSSILKRALRFSSERSIPTISQKSLRSWWRSYTPPPSATKVIYLFADEFTNQNDTEVGIAFIKLMGRLGYRVIIPNHYESGRGSFSKGLLKRGRRLAIKNVKALSGVVSQQSPLVGIEPSALLSFRDEYPNIVPQELRESAQQLSTLSLLYDEFIMKEFEEGRIESSLFSSEELEILLHGHCHQKSLASIEASAKMLSIPKNYRVRTLDSGCCGMAGSFGYEREHYKLSMEIGEQKLFPAVRESGDNVIISAPGTSCREQIYSGTNRRAYHPIEILYKALLT
ncbi:MAG: FAD-linked oxidase C-terminal domain-containing protein [Bacteroidales bacterium]